MAVWGLVLLLAGAVGQHVNYPLPVCAVKGSTVTLPCTFTPKKSVVLIKIIRVVWCRNHEICQGSTPSVYDSNIPNNNPRYTYLGDKDGNCTLRITDLQEEDEATLRFRMEANNKSAHFTGRAGVNVTVSDGNQMKVESSSDQKFKEGEAVTLHCTARCTFHQLEVTWFRDGRALSHTGHSLGLGALTAEDSGNYTCGLKNKVGAVSQPYSLNIPDEEEKGGGVELALVVGVVFGVLLTLLTLTLVFCIITRKLAAAAAVGRQVEQKFADDVYSEVLPSAEGGSGRHRLEPSGAVEDVSYAAVQFKHNNQARPAKEAEDGIIYSSVARS